MVRASIMKVNKGTVDVQTNDEKDSEQVDIDKNVHDKVKELLLEKFPDSLIENEHNRLYSN